MNTERVIQKLHEQKESGVPIIVAGVGSGLTAKAAADGGADLLAVYNTAIYRIRGVPTALAFLPYDNANELTLCHAPEVMANAGGLPVVLGLGAHDPRSPIQRLIDQVEHLGAIGVTNEPFLGIYSEDLQAQLEAAQIGFSREVALIRESANRGLLSLGWVFNPDQAIQMVENGAQILGTMLGVTAGGVAGGQSRTTIDLAVKAIDAIMEAALRTQKDVIVLTHGGPLNDPHSVAEVQRRTGAHGYVTGSTGERIPVEKSVAEAIRRFKMCLQ